MLIGTILCSSMVFSLVSCNEKKAEELGGGLTGKLKVIVENGKIIECKMKNM